MASNAPEWPSLRQLKGQLGTRGVAKPLEGGRLFGSGTVAGPWTVANPWTVGQLLTLGQLPDLAQWAVVSPWAVGLLLTRELGGPWTMRQLPTRGH